MPVPGPTTAWEQAWSALREMVGKGHQAIQELVGRISRGLMVRVGGVDNATLMGNFAYDMLRVL
jgi:hypothetical protein